MLRRFKLLFKAIFLTMTFNIAFSEVTVTIGNVSVDGYTGYCSANYSFKSK